MQRLLFLLVSLQLVGSGCAGLIATKDSEHEKAPTETESPVAADSQAEESPALWPEIEPFETGTFRVSELHELYYELCGNPAGKPVFVLHGGPGTGCSPYYRRFFDPEKFLVVLHDQRGAGKSKPYAEARENDTQAMVEDIERLRAHLGLGKVLLFGGSWGTTLGLAYGETYPESVSGMVLRGIFTATAEEIDHFYHGGAAVFFPETHEKLLAALPDPDRRPLPATLLELMTTGDAETRARYARAWVAYEIKLCSLEISDERINEILDKNDVLAFGFLENHYMANGCFLEEGQLLRDAHRLSHVPITLINGRYDMVCPPVTAYRLHRKLPKSTLVIVENAGHWMGDERIEAALLEAVKTFE